MCQRLAYLSQNILTSLSCSSTIRMPFAHELPNTHRPAAANNFDNGRLTLQCSEDTLLPRQKISPLLLSALSKRTFLMDPWPTPFFLSQSRCLNSSVNLGKTGAVPTICLEPPQASNRSSHMPMPNTRKKLKAGTGLRPSEAEAISSIRTKTKAAIWHCEDHRGRQAVCYCPCLYHQALTGTFENPDIFKETVASFGQQLVTWSGSETCNYGPGSQKSMGIQKTISYSPVEWSYCIHSSPEEETIRLRTSDSLFC